MSKAYITYICVFAFSGAALWVILTFGRSIEAPPDISGGWRVKWDRPPAFSPAETVMKVDQSGRFVHVTFGTAKPMSLKMDDPHETRQELRNPVIKMRNDLWTLTLTGNLRSEVHVNFSGPTRHTATATRVGAARTTTPNAH
jgi:hypothetical protein